MMVRMAHLALATAFFAGLALDITVPATVLSVMGLCRWLLVNGMPGSSLEERAA
ncbi:hypothetical protein SAMN05880582_101265 [Rhizobium sp. RU20A]|uniref:hypothetical protein n=1 Tax=Rhizobium sp. RU20A TaxID=1907412 RepID=UPI000956CA06|nr:hypothetical protein [Rhizobium sp. RU20A]SIP98300.1 hypothetical protein SAMN05880582_101265 [Rhizobium sp. RU20A]